MSLAFRPLILLVLCCLSFIESAEHAEDNTELHREDNNADEQAEDDTKKLHTEDMYADEHADDNEKLSIVLSIEDKDEELSTEDNDKELSTENTSYLNTTMTTSTVSTTTEVVLRESVATNTTRKSYLKRGFHSRADKEKDDKETDDNEVVQLAFVTFRKKDGDKYSAFVGGCLLREDAVLTVAKPFFEVKTALVCVKVIRDVYNFHKDIYVVANAESTRGDPKNQYEDDDFLVRRSEKAVEQWRDLAYLAHHKDFKPYKMDENNYAVAVTMKEFTFHGVHQRGFGIHPRQARPFLNNDDVKCYTVGHNGEKATVIQLPILTTNCQEVPKGLKSEDIICIKQTAKTPKLDPNLDLGNPLICVQMSDEGEPQRGVIGIAVAAVADIENVYLKTDPAIPFIDEAMIDDATTIIVDAILRDPTKLAIYFFFYVFFHQLMN